ncbi:MAG TPA: multidrug efflux RND transporter permease subunit [Gemmatimonadales bacterium]
MSHPAPTGAPSDIKYFFIRRPVMAGVIAIVITLLGLVSLKYLPVNRYPSITPPSIRITAAYPGATAEDVANAVAAPIEQQLSGLRGLLYYKSSNASDGSMSLQVFFDISRDQDLAAVDVQNAVKRAEPQLPQEVTRNGVVVTKAQTDILLVAALSSDDPRYDADYLTNYATLYVADEVKRLPGVGDATVFGGGQFAMLLQLDPERMSQLGLTVDDVASAVREQNAPAPAGRIGREPAPPGTEFTLPVTALGRLQTVDQFNHIIVRAGRDGSVVHLSDIAHVKLGGQSSDLEGRLNGKPTTFFLLYLQPGANALTVKRELVQRLTELQSAFPAGIHWSIPFDTTPFISSSIEEVTKTLLEAMALVTLVVFLFLQSWRATLIPVLAVPVSVIGTFLGLLALGFSINVLTLFGLVLAIGIVVDDAIVVIENVERIMTDEGLDAQHAADKAMQQVAGALVAIVLSLCAVFIPVAFLGGITGSMFRQFAVTIVIAVVLSGIVALTLTPALCAALLKESPERAEHGRFFTWFNTFFDRVRVRYLGGVAGVLRRPRAFLAAFAVILALIVVLYRHVPTGFLPTEDKGFFVVAVQLPSGASLQRTREVVTQVEKMLLADKGINAVVELVGLDILSSANQPNSAVMFVGLKPWDERGKNESADAILARVNGALYGMPKALAFAFNFPEIPGLGTTSGLELNLQARAGQDVETFNGQVNEFMQALAKEPAVVGGTTTFRIDAPQIFLNVDREAVKARDVKLGTLFLTLQTMLSTLYINDFNLYGRTYRVQAEAAPQFRRSPDDIGRLFVRSEDGEMIPISTLARPEFRTGPSILSRFNGFTSALITAQPAPGHSSGEMLAAIEGLIGREFSSKGVGYAYSGQSYQERISSGQGGMIFGLGIVLVFLVLAAQYESWSIPFAVLFGIPFGALGALIGVWMRGMPDDIYFQVGLITVIGLAAKNAILIIEFATSLRASGRSIMDSAREAARERFRPILMTSLAFIAGVSPLLLAGGAGAQSRHSLGTGVFFGMLIATSVGVFFIPLFFTVIRRLAEPRRPAGEDA